MREMLMFNYHWIPSWLLPMMGSHMSLSNLLPILPSSSFTAPHAFHSIAVNTWSAMYKVVQRQWYWPWTRLFLCLSSLASLKGNFHTQFPMQWKTTWPRKSKVPIPVELLLFNLDNHHLFHYSFLFGYMHNMLEGKYPIATCQRACSQYHKISSATPPVPLHLLYKAWNEFARQLDIDMEQSFQYPVCVPCPDVVCDGTMIGYLLLPLVNHELANLQPIWGSHHKERVYICTTVLRLVNIYFAN